MNDVTARASSRELLSRLEEAKKLLAEPGTELWRHKKGGIYRRIGLTINADTTEVMVRYVRVGGPGYETRNNEGSIEWSRPLSEWLEPDRFIPVYETKHFKTVRESDDFPPHVALSGLTTKAS